MYLTAIPLVYHDDDHFWGRDMGLLAKGMRENGVDARVVAIGERKKYASDLPLILGSLKDLENPQWWRDLDPKGVVLNTWSAPRYDAIRRAVLEATPRVIEKLDTGGVRSPRVWIGNYLLQTYGGYVDSKNPIKRVMAPISAPVRTWATRYLPALLDKRMAASMSLMPLLAAESPIAVARIQRYLRYYHDEIPEVVCIPHPVADDYMNWDDGPPKENRIVSVGRWDSFQKNFPLLVKVLTEFLQIHPDWSADIVGTLPQNWQSVITQSDKFPRIRFLGRLEHREISTVYQRAKIFLISSRYESFNIAAAEALCCGCSV
ncbi:MAG: glycosyltransferase, partial [bacterium]